jgi:hypothetical protein
MKKRFNESKLAVIAYAVLMTGVILFACQPHSFAQTNVGSLAAELPTLSLTVVGSNGTVVVLNASGIANLSPCSGNGAWKGYCGAINDLGNYTGVSLVTLCSLVGGINSGESLVIKSVDNSSQTFNYSQVMGDFVTYDNTTGEEVQPNDSLTPILAYHFNGENVTDGPLKIAIVDSEGLATYKPLWAENVVELDILENSDLPEFPPFIMTVLFVIATIVTLVGARKFEKKLNAR